MFLEIDVSGIENKIEKCESTEEFKKEIIPLIKTEKEEWTEKITAIIKASGLSKTKFADICGVSRGSVNKWCKGSVPKKKETFLKIAGVAHYNADEIKELLQRYGKCSRLDVENEKEDYNIFYTSIISFIEVNYEKNNVTISK